MSNKYKMSNTWKLKCRLYISIFAIRPVNILYICINACTCTQPHIFPLESSEVQRQFSLYMYIFTFFLFIINNETVTHFPKKLNNFAFF